MTTPGQPAEEPSNKTRRLGARYWMLLAATGASALGDGLVLVAFPLLAITLTTRPVLIAGVAIAGQLPWLLVSLPAGAIADRVDHRRLLAAVEMTRAVVLLAFGLMVITGHDSLAAIYVAVLLIGALETAFSAAIRACLPTLVDHAVLARANGYLLSAETTGEEFAGPALGGVAFAWSNAVPFLADALSYVASAVLLSLALPAQGTRSPSPNARFLKEVAFGVKWFLGHPLLRLLALVVAVFAFCQMIVMSVLVLYGTRVLHLSDSAYGLFLAAGALGNVVGGVVVGPIHARLGAAKVVILAGVGGATGYIILGSSSLVAVAAVGLGIEALSVAIGTVVTLSLRQVLIPAELLGRVNNAFRTCVFGALPIGALTGGVLASSLGLKDTFVLAGLIQATAVALVGARIVHRIDADAARRVESVKFDPGEPDPGPV